MITKNDFIELVSRHMDKMEDAGCGMYNLSIYGGLTMGGNTYRSENIFQIYPLKDSEYYGDIYVLLYYKDRDGDWSNYCVSFDEMTDEETEQLYRKVSVALGEKTNDAVTEEDIKALCLGRDDLLSVAEAICNESGLGAADGEVLCEELARTCIDYLNWINKPVEETK